MNKERYNQIIDEVYENWKSRDQDFWEEQVDGMFTSELGEEVVDRISKECFINKIKTDPEFSKMWGLKIEERELSLEDRMILCKEKWDYSWNRTINIEDIEWRMNNEWNIPTKLITLTYNNETIECYE